MNGRATLGTLLTSALLAVVPSVAEACSCDGTIPSSVAFRTSTVVFVGTVERVDETKPWSRMNPDGSITVASDSGPRVVTFAVIRAFRGVAETRIQITGTGTNCDVPVGLEQIWLVYASEHQGGTTATACSRTRLIAQAGEDLKYLEGLAAGRQQGLVRQWEHRWKLWASLK